MTQRQIAVICPEWVRGDVGNDRLLCAVSGRSARTHAGADDEAVNCLRVGYWQAGRCAMPKPVGFRVQQKDRRQRTAGQFFEYSAGALQDKSAKIAPGYHLKKPFLAAQQHLGPLALGDLRRATYELRQIPGCIQDRMADRMDVFDRPVRKKDSEFPLVI